MRYTGKIVKGVDSPRPLMSANTGSASHNLGLGLGKQAVDIYIIYCLLPINNQTRMALSAPWLYGDLFCFGVSSEK